MARAIQRPTVILQKPLVRQKTKEALLGWLFALPWLVGFVLFTAGPMLFSLYTSFTRYNILTSPRWIGLANYHALLNDDRFYRAVGNTLWMVVFKIPVVVVVSIAIALLLNMNVPGGKVFRTIFYLPNIFAGVAAVFLWKWILMPNGIFNRGLELIGLPSVGWFTDPDWTKPGLVIMGLWWIGGNILIYLASLKAIPPVLYEAAVIDGATSWTKTRYITLPLLTPTIFFQIVTGIIGTFQIFTTAYILTGADGSNSETSQALLFYVLYLYNRAFGRMGAGGFQMGYAAAMAWILFAIVLAITAVQLYLARRWVYYESSGR